MPDIGRWFCEYSSQFCDIVCIVTFVCRFYERLLMNVIANYLDPFPFFQGYAMLCLCIIILAMECT